LREKGGAGGKTDEFSQNAAGGEGKRGTLLRGNVLCRQATSEKNPTSSESGRPLVEGKSSRGKTLCRGEGSSTVIPVVREGRAGELILWGYSLKKSGKKVCASDNWQQKVKM